MSYYKLLLLDKNQIFLQGNTLRSVDLNNIENNLIICNDKDINTKSKGSYLWVSGGGSFLIDERYLIVVKRDSKTLINPGQLSLFTGRSDCISEWKNPLLLIRELIEELEISINNTKLLITINNEYNLKIKDSYTIFEEYKSIYDELLININHKANKISGLITINQNNEINFIRLFKLNFNLESLTFKDNEHLNCERELYFIDIKEMKISSVRNGTKWDYLDLTKCGFNLKYLLYKLMKV